MHSLKIVVDILYRICAPGENLVLKDLVIILIFIFIGYLGNLNEFDFLLVSVVLFMAFVYFINKKLTL